MADNMCPVLLEPFTRSGPSRCCRLRCGHNVSELAVGQILAAAKPSCPLCRHALLHSSVAEAELPVEVSSSDQLAILCGLVGNLPKGDTYDLGGADVRPRQCRSGHQLPVPSTHSGSEALRVLEHWSLAPYAPAGTGPCESRGLWAWRHEPDAAERSATAKYVLRSAGVTVRNAKVTLPQRSTLLCVSHGAAPDAPQARVPVTAFADLTITGPGALLVLKGGGTGFQLDRVKFEGCAVVVFGGASAAFSGCSWEAASVGVMASGDKTAVTLDTCSFLNCQQAVCACDRAEVSLKDTNAARCGWRGLEARDAGSRLVAAECLIECSGTAEAARACCAQPGVARSVKAPTGVLVHSGASAKLTATHVVESDGYGVRVLGASSSLAIQSSTVRGASLDCANIMQGASATVIACSLLDSGRGGGVVVSGSGSKADVRKCHVTGCKQMGAECSALGTLGLRETRLNGSELGNAAATSGAFMMVTRSTLSGSTRGHGLVAEGTDTVVEVELCELVSNAWHGAVVRGSAKATFEESRVVRNGTCGVCAADEASCIVQKGVVSENQSSNVAVVDSAKLTMVSSLVARAGTWHGLTLRGPGARAELESVAITECRHAVAVSGGAKLVATKCIFAACTGTAVCVQSDAVGAALTACKLEGSQGYGMRVDFTPDHAARELAIPKGRIQLSRCALLDNVRGPMGPSAARFGGIRLWRCSLPRGWAQKDAAAAATTYDTESRLYGPARLTMCAPTPHAHRREPSAVALKTCSRTLGKAGPASDVPTASVRLSVNSATLSGSDSLPYPSPSCRVLARPGDSAWEHGSMVTQHGARVPSAALTQHTASSHSVPVRAFTMATSDSMSLVTTAPPEARNVESTLERLLAALEAFSKTGLLLCGRYAVLGVTEQRAGGQGVVQFVFDTTQRVDCAVKFFFKRHAFECERALYSEQQLKPLMAATQMVCANADGAFQGPNGWPLPPFVVLEKGEALDEHIRAAGQRAEAMARLGMGAGADVATQLQAVMHATQCVASLHALGWAHRDLKPSNVLRVPRTHCWTLIDFGSAARIGRPAALEFTPPYASPEVVAAYEAKSSSVIAGAATDVWALGLIALEVFTGARAFQPGAPLADTFARIAGRLPLPWEVGGGREGELQRLRGFKRIVLQCLDRNPERRPSAAALLASWQHVFDATTVRSTTYRAPAC